MHFITYGNAPSHRLNSSPTVQDNFIVYFHASCRVITRLSTCNLRETWASLLVGNIYYWNCFVIYSSFFKFHSKISFKIISRSFQREKNLSYSPGKLNRIAQVRFINRFKSIQFDLFSSICTYNGCTVI